MPHVPPDFCPAVKPEFVAYFTPRPIDNCERGPPRLVDPPCLRNVVGCRGLETVWDEQSNEHNKPRYRAPPVACAFASGGGGNTLGMWTLPPHSIIIRALL